MNQNSNRFFSLLCIVRAQKNDDDDCAMLQHFPFSLSFQLPSKVCLLLCKVDCRRFCKGKRARLGLLCKLQLKLIVAKFFCSF